MKKAWVATILVFLATLATACGYFKVPPMMMAMLQDLNAGLAAGGWLMSMGSLAGIILALPAGGIMIKTGPKNLGLFSLACFIVGNAIGAFAPNISLLLLGRLIEGIGFGLLPVLAPAIIAAWFTPEKRGLPMGVWSIATGLGSLVIFNLTNVIVPAFGWRGDWWILAIAGVVIFILFALFLKLPDLKTESAKQETAEKKTSFIEGLKTPGAWVLAFTFFCFGVGVSALTSFLPTFYVQTLNMDPARANTITSLAILGLIVGCLVMGAVLNKVRNRSVVLIIVTIVTAILFYMNFNFTIVNLLVPYLFITGLFNGAVPTAILTMTPDTATSKGTVGVALGIAIIGQQLGMFVGPALLGAVVESSGGLWTSLNLPLVIFGVLEVIGAILYYVVMKKKATTGVSMGAN